VNSANALSFAAAFPEASTTAASSAASRKFAATPDAAIAAAAAIGTLGIAGYVKQGRRREKSAGGSYV
jgi:hypothetical protein